ncbi:MAG: amidohydrolase [Bacteroidota bacterium]
MNNLTVTIVQTDLHWEDSAKNLARLTEKLDQLTAPTDIIVLPEMFTTGFTMFPETLAEAHEGKGLQWMIQQAKQKKCVLTGSVSVSDGTKFYNRLYWVMPDGTYKHYDKRHLFQMGNEHQHYTAGTQRLIVEYKGWKICPLICYDLRFPVWARNRKENAYDLLLYVANWPEVRSYPWKQLLIARAIENQAYVVGVNRVGNDGNHINHSGDSAVINPRGELLSQPNSNQEVIEAFTLSGVYLQEFRKLFPVMTDGDEFDIL